MIIKIPLYIDLVGSVKDPTVFSEVIRRSLETQLIGPEYGSIPLDLKQWRKTLEKHGEDPTLKAELVRKEVLFGS